MRLTAGAGAAQHTPSLSGPDCMERRPFGSVPREVAVIGQGTWYIVDAHRPTAVAALRRGRFNGGGLRPAIGAIETYNLAPYYVRFGASAQIG